VSTNKTFSTHFAAILLLILHSGPAVAGKEGLNVTTTTMEELLFYPTHSVPATVLSLNRSQISVESPGLLLHLPVRVGDSVTEGQPLAILDCRETQVMLKQAKAAHRSAQARLTLAQRQIKRTRSLLKERNISEEVLNQREADLNTSLADVASSEAVMEKAALDVEQCHIQAPFAGIVVERVAGEGEWVSPGQPLLKLIDNERLEVSAQIPLDQVDSMAQSAGFLLRTNSRSYDLTLRSLLPVVDALGRNQEARLEFKGRMSLPGSSGRLTWQSAKPHLPADIPVRRNGVLGLFLEREGIAHFHPIQGALEGRPVAIDLPPGSRIIVEGRRGLQDGDTVVTAD